jgi:hypothetical protein
VSLFTQYGAASFRVRILVGVNSLTSPGSRGNSGAMLLVDPYPSSTATHSVRAQCMMESLKQRGMSMAAQYIRRRRVAASLLACAAIPPLLAAGSAHALSPVSGKVILTVSGAITNTNRASEAVFDRAMLEALGSDKVTTTTPWNSGPDQFEGIKLETLMEVLGATGSSVTAYALNDFTTRVPVSDFKRFHPIMALKRNGEYMPVRDKGPLFIVYPYDSDPELRQQVYYNRSAWQIARLIIE